MKLANSNDLASIHLFIVKEFFLIVSFIAQFIFPTFSRVLQAGSFLLQEHLRKTFYHYQIFLEDPLTIALILLLYLFNA